jgi:hypothetical protein
VTGTYFYEYDNGSMTKRNLYNFNTLKNKLTRLGIGLYYLYLLLIMAGAAGMIFGTYNIILKFFNLGMAANSSWIEVTILTLFCAYMIKFFIAQKTALLSPDKIRELPEPHEGPAAIPEVTKGNVIPFKKRSFW